ncbi:MAG TPA: HAMP domain-containing sensor histidine kinase [Gemmatimonadaceae bacterium]
MQGVPYSAHDDQSGSVTTGQKYVRGHPATGANGVLDSTATNYGSYNGRAAHLRYKLSQVGGRDASHRATPGDQAMDSEHIRRRARMTGIAGWLSMVPVAMVVVALCTLAVRPFVISRELTRMRVRTAATSERAQGLLTDLRLVSAQEVGEHEAYRLRHEPATAERYRQLRAHEDRTLADMELLADVAGPRSAAQVDSLRALASRAHQLTDGYVNGDISDARFVQQLPAMHAIHDSTTAVLAALDTSLARARNADVVSGGRIIAQQRVVTIVIGALALFAIAVVVMLARRDQALSRQLGEALEEEARAREDAERRRTELEQVTESKTRLMRGFTHDVKNPIGAADGFMQLLEDGLSGPVTRTQASHIERARRCLAEALHLIDDLLELARAEAGQLDVRKENVDLTALAQDTVEEYRAQAERKGLTLGVQANGGGVFARSDPARLRQVLGNLVSNAVKYTTRGSVDVRIAARRRDGDGSAPGAAIEVADTGSGIPAEQQRLIFQEFVRLDPNGVPGAGVGLAISQRIAQALDGEIKMTSVAGRGSSFILWLPSTDDGRTIDAVASDSPLDRAHGGSSRRPARGIGE